MGPVLYPSYFFEIQSLTEPVEPQFGKSGRSESSIHPDSLTQCRSCRHMHAAILGLCVAPKDSNSVLHPYGVK